MERRKPKHIFLEKTSRDQYLRWKTECEKRGIIYRKEYIDSNCINYVLKHRSTPRL